MRIVNINEIGCLAEAGSVVTVGNFDGVHIGHDLLIKDVVARAASMGLCSVIVTFEPHTRAVLFPEEKQQVLSTLEEKVILINRKNVDYLVYIPFDSNFAAIPAGDFIENILVKKLKARQWVMGEGHKFGKNHAGNKNFPHDSKGKNDIYMVTDVSMTLNDRVVSSTEIRIAVMDGRVDEAVKMLGHQYLILSHRVAGEKKGSQLGYPTFNFECRNLNKVLPPPGIYAAEIEYKGRRWKGAMYFGDCPTFGNRNRHFEFHAFDYCGGEPVEGAVASMWLNTRTRADKAFDNKTLLIEAIKQDIENIKKYFSQEKEQCQ